MSDLPVEASGKPDDVRRALALLNAAGARIGNSLDLQTTARELLDVAVPQFCDLASVDLFEEVLAGDEPPPVGPGDASAQLRRVAFGSAVSDAPLTLGASDTAPGRPHAAEASPHIETAGAGHPRLPAQGGPREQSAPATERATTEPSAESSPQAAEDATDAGHPAPGQDDPVHTPPEGTEQLGTAVTLGATHRYLDNSPYAEALRTGRVQHVPGQDSSVPAQFGAVVQSTLAVPMVARDRVLGLVQFSRAKGSEPFGERESALAAELAGRAAVFIDNARLYRREHERALILQRSLLPPDDPEATGLDIACRYLPGNPATEVGGDWFDVIELPGMRTAIVIGDVMGRGLRAAVAMGELRSAVRTLALTDMEPAEVLGALDEIARGLGGTPRSQRGTTDLAEVYLATCIYAVYDPVSRRCTFANAGHLPPVLVEPGEDALLLEVPKGVPLGVGGEPFEEIEVELPDGALLALYTDGLVESREHPLDEGLDRFRSALTNTAEPLEDTADSVLRTLNVHHGEDDIALLMARVHGLPRSSVGDWSLDSEPRSVARARELTRRQLAEWQIEELADTAELLVSELVTNALRHGSGEIRLRLMLERTLVCEVWDRGLVQPRRRRAHATDEGGRGLQLVDLLSSGWGSRRTPHGKAVWFQLSRPESGAPRPDPTEAVLSLF